MFINTLALQLMRESLLSLAQIVAYSIMTFTRDELLSCSKATKYAFYDWLSREDVNLRKLQLLTAKKVFKTNTCDSVFVVDDLSKIIRVTEIEGSYEPICPVNQPLGYRATSR